MKLFPEIPDSVTNDELSQLTGISDADRTWVKSLSEEERPAGIAFVQWKKAEYRTFDKMSRPRLWMEGFLLAMDYSNANKEKPDGNAHE